MNLFVNSIIQCIQTGLLFVLNPNNIQITSGILLIFAIVFIFSRGVGKVIETIITVCIIVYIIYSITQQYAVPLNISGFWMWLQNLIT